MFCRKPLTSDWMCLVEPAAFRAFGANFQRSGMSAMKCFFLLSSALALTIKEVPVWDLTFSIVLGFLLERFVQKESKSQKFSRDSWNSNILKPMFVAFFWSLEFLFFRIPKVQDDVAFANESLSGYGECNRPNRWCSTNDNSHIYLFQDTLTKPKVCFIGRLDSQRDSMGEISYLSQRVHC